MSRGIVTAVEPVSRLANIRLLGSNSELVDVEIPASINFVVDGCEVEVEEKSNLIVVVISFPHGIKQDPLGLPTIGAKTEQTFVASDYVNNGDFLLNIPEGGFAAFLKGFVGIFGSSPVAQILTFGTKKLVKLISKNFEWEGGDNLKVKINSEEGFAPSIDIKIGGLSIHTNTTTDFSLSLANLCHLYFDQESIRLELLSTEDGQLSEVFSYDFSEEDGENAYFFKWYQSFYSSFRKMVIKATDLHIQSSVIKFSATNMVESVAGVKTSHIKQLKQTVDGHMDISAGNFDLNVGGVSPGKIELSNSVLSNFRMDPKGGMQLRAPTGLDLVGRGDFLVSYTLLLPVLVSMQSAITALSSGLATWPYGAAQAAAANAALAPAISGAPLIMNPLLRCGLVPDPTL